MVKELDLCFGPENTMVLLGLNMYIGLIWILLKQKKIVQEILMLSLNESQGQGQQKKFPIQVHLVHIDIKYMGKLCKEIFRFQCGTAAAAAHMSVKQRARQL